MRYLLSNPEESKAASEYLAGLIILDAEVEIKRVSKRRSLNQNSFYWLKLTAFALETGFTLDESATILKREVNPDLFVYEKNGQKFLKSSADLDTSEMGIAIDRFHKYAADSGISLPLASDESWLRSIENAYESQRRHL